MELNPKHVVVAVVLSFAVGLATGRLTTPEKVRIETKTVTQTQTKDDKTTQVNTDKDQHVQVVKTETKKPDGTTVTVTRLVKDTDTRRNVNQEDKSDATTSQTVTQSKEVDASKSRITISTLVGLDVSNLTGGPVYGASATRPFLGPICLGVWGFTNKTAGVSLGLQF